jgi:hypothetical protein
MSSTYSSYKFELIGTGEQAGTWGASTNTNIGTAIEQAIGGYVTVTFTATTKTLTLSNTNVAQDARALYLNLTGSPGGAATLEVPAIQKAYIIKNATTGGYTVTAKVTGMTGVDIPNGKTMLVYNNGTDVVLAHDNFSAPVTVNVNSSSDALRVTQTGSGNALIVEDSTNPDATPFVITSDGIGVVGYTASTTNGSILPSLFQVNGIACLQSSWWGNDAFGPIQYFQKARSGTYGTQGIVSNSDLLGFISFQGSDGVGFIPGASIRAVVQGTPGVNDMPTKLVFSTTYDGAATPTTALTINSEGVIEVGSGSGATASGTLMKFTRDMTATAGLNSYGVFVTSAITSATSQAFSFYSDATTAATAFTLTNLNHYGAGATTPGAGSTITNMRGFYVTSSMSTATNNYGFVSALASATNTWGFYASGTANNAFNGNCRFGGVTAPVATVDVTGSVAATTTILSSGATSGIGYTTGAGGTVTQATSRTTGVTLNKTTGAITLVSAAGSASYQSFTVTNSAVAATDVVIVNQKSGTDKYIILVTAVAAGSFQITFATTGGTTTEQPVFNFAVIKGVAA